VQIAFIQKFASYILSWNMKLPSIVYQFKHLVVVEHCMQCVYALHDF